MCSALKLVDGLYQVIAVSAFGINLCNLVRMAYQVKNNSPSLFIQWKKFNSHRVRPQAERFDNNAYISIIFIRDISMYINNKYLCHQKQNVGDILLLSNT